MRDINTAQVFWEEEVKTTLVHSNECGHGSGTKQQLEGLQQKSVPFRSYYTGAKLGVAMFATVLLAVTVSLGFLSSFKRWPALVFPELATPAEPAGVTEAASLLSAVEAEGIATCGEIEEGVRFEPSDFNTAWHVASKSWGGCCKLCDKDIHCEVWTWIQHKSKCALGTLRPTGLLERMQEQGSASGRSARLAAFSGGNDTNNWGDSDLVIKSGDDVRDVVAILVIDKEATDNLTSREHRAWGQTQQALEKSSQELGLTDQGHEEFGLDDDETAQSSPSPEPAETKTPSKPTASIRPTTVMTSTTVTTSIAKTTIANPTAPTWGWPSLFCITVATLEAKQGLALVEAQFRNMRGVFSCQEFAVFSKGRPHVLGPNVSGHTVKTIAVPQNSELAPYPNQKDNGHPMRTFMAIWDMVVADGRFRRHEWTVKVDPAVVFFPDRLRSRLLAPTAVGGPAVLVNCRTEAHDTLLENLQVLSQEALVTYSAQQEECQKALPWLKKGFAEGEFILQCLGKLGVRKLDAFTMLADARCQSAPCSEKWHVAFSNYTGVKDWFACFEESQKASQQHYQ